MSTPPQVYLITGTSTGLGLSLAHAVLASGHKLVATSRNPSKTPDAVAAITTAGGVWLPLDVTSPDLEQQVDAVLKVHGYISVLVNNAGVAIGGAAEDVPLSKVREVFETNFFGEPFCLDEVFAAVS